MKYITTVRMEDLGFDFVLSLGWRNSQFEPSARVKAMRSQTVSGTEKEKRKRRGVTQEWEEEEREAGQVGIVSPVPLLFIHPGLGGVGGGNLRGC